MSSAHHPHVVHMSSRSVHVVRTGWQQLCIKPTGFLVLIQETKGQKILVTKLQLRRFKTELLMLLSNKPIRGNMASGGRDRLSPPSKGRHETGVTTSAAQILNSECNTNTKQ